MTSLVTEYNQYFRENPNKWSSVVHDEIVFEILDKYPRPKSFLDVGCGNGHTISYFEQHWPSVSFTGLDLSSVAIDIAEKKSSAEFICGFLDDFNPGVKYDMITLIGVAEHFINLDKSLQHLKNLLSENGVVFIEVPNCIAFPTSKKEEGYRRLEQGSRQMEWHLFRKTWEGILERAGFDFLEKIKGEQLWMEFQWVLTLKR